MTLPTDPLHQRQARRPQRTHPDGIRTATAKSAAQVSLASVSEVEARPCIAQGPAQPAWAEKTTPPGIVHASCSSTRRCRSPCRRTGRAITRERRQSIRRCKGRTEHRVLEWVEISACWQFLTCCKGEHTGTGRRRRRRPGPVKSPLGVCRGHRPVHFPGDVRHVGMFSPIASPAQTPSSEAVGKDRQPPLRLAETA